jgi:hypothetical protein
MSGVSDAGGYIKASLIVGDKVVKKRKTSIRKATQNGFVWNEGLSFDVDSKILARCRLELVVMECDKLGNHYPIGQLIFGSTEAQPTKASKLWKEALEGRTSLPQWVQLQEVKS